MPGSLLLASPTLRGGVTRNESTRSDSSAASNTSQSSAAGNKKVSFNKAVRVKKYPRPKKSGDPQGLPNGDAAYHHLDPDDPGTVPGKRFWFKVYKNKHRQSPDPAEFRKSRVIYYGNDGDDGVISYHPNPSALNTSECGTQTPNRKTALLGNEFTPLHPSQMPPEPPSVKRNHVRKIVDRFNEEAVFQRQRSSESPPLSPPGSPRYQSTPKHIPVPPPPPPPGYGTAKRTSPTEGLFSASRFKRNPIVNGVKVIFGMGHSKKGGKSKSPPPNGDLYGGGPYKTEILLSDGSETEVKTPYDSFHYGDYKPNRTELVRRSEDKLDFPRFDDDDRYDDDGYRYRHFENGAQSSRKSKYHVETYDTGNQLLFDTEDVNTATTKTDKGEFTSTVGEKHQLWRNDKRIIVYEEQSPTIIRRKAKSHGDLSARDSPQEQKLDKGLSTDDLWTRQSDKKESLSKKQKESWLKHFRSNTKEKGIQCSKIPTDEPEELYGFGRYKIIRPRNGIVTTFSRVPTLEKSKADRTTTSQVDGHIMRENVIYSQVDKTKKKKSSEKDKKKHTFADDGRVGGLFKSRSEPLYIGPPPKSHRQVHRTEDAYDTEDRAERKVKTSKRSFGFKLSTGRDDDTRDGSKTYYLDEDWYNVDGEVEAAERQKNRSRSHRDISEVRQELQEEEELTEASSLSNGEHKDTTPGSVMREVDYKKREISYENVPRTDGDIHGHSDAGSGLWYREADEDYRREMAQSEVSYPAGDSVGSDRFYTVDRRQKSSKKLPPPSPRAYTLDRRHLKEKQRSVPNTSGVKILVNGKEVGDRSPGRKSKSRGRRDDSVQSDPLYLRGGLAAAYQARQRAAVRRSNSSVSGLSGGGSPRVRRIQASSELSAASSESDSLRRRRPLVMYIPGVNHPERSSENDERLSGSGIARSQSMMSSSRPPQRPARKSHRGKRPELYRSGGEAFEEDRLMPLASERRKPPKVPADYRKQSDVKRRHSMPKDTKFSWLKWRIRGKPSREP